CNADAQLAVRSEFMGPPNLGRSGCRPCRSLSARELHPCSTRGPRRSHRRLALRVEGRCYEWTPTRFSLRTAATAQEPGLYGCGSDHTGFGSWCKLCRVQCRGCGDAPAIALPSAGTID